MKFKKLVSAVAALALSVAACAGLAVTASAAEPKTVYTRTAADWSSADVGEGQWSGSPEAKAGTGLSLSYKNTSVETSKDLSITANSIVQLTGTWTSGGGPGRSGSYDYFYLGDDICIKAYTQDQKSALVVNGTETDLGINGRSARFTFDVTIDTAMKTITGLTIKVKDKTFSCANTILNHGTVSSLKFGHNKAGKENYGQTSTLEEITVKETKQTVDTAAYTINYKLEDGTVVKQVSGTSTVGSKIPADTSFWVTEGDVSTKYMTTAETAQELIVTANAEENVLDVTVRSAEKYTCIVNANAGGEITELKRAADVVEGETFKYSYPLYVKKGDTLYTKGATNDEYNGSIVAASDKATDGVITISLDYAATEINNVVYYSEAENIAGLTATQSKNIAVRSSNSAAAYAEDDVTITSLPAGKYKVYGTIFAGSTAGAYLDFTLGTNTFQFSSAGASNWESVESEEFTLTDTTDLVFKKSGASNAALDFIYVVRTGEYVAPPSAPTVTVAEVGERVTDKDGEKAQAYKASFVANNYTLKKLVWSVNPAGAANTAITKEQTLADITAGEGTKIVAGLVVTATDWSKVAGVTATVE